MGRPVNVKSGAGGGACEQTCQCEVQDGRVCEHTCQSMCWVPRVDPGGGMLGCGPSRVGVDPGGSMLG